MWMTTRHACRRTDIEVDGLGGGRLRLRTEVAPRHPPAAAARSLDVVALPER
jgi:hypothetical protein